MKVLKIKITNCFNQERIIDWELEEDEDPEEAFNDYAWGVAEEWRDDNGGEPMPPTVEWLNRDEFVK